MTASPRGLDLDALRPWLADQVEVVGDLHADLIVGGRSNLTYRVRDDRSTWIVRRPPLGHVLATAHDMGREYRVMDALRDTDVPVPAMHARCDDPDVVGAPFYVMEDVDGVALRTAAELAELGEGATRDLSTHLAQTLAALHRVDPASVGLADFGRPENFLGRQVSRWTKQLEASRSRDLAGVDTLLAGLADPPPSPPPAIVHGDYRLDNCLVRDGHIRAVVDWEMATLGDPLTDLALLLVYARLAEVTKAEPGLDSAILVDASNAPGFLSRAELVEAYLAAGGPEPTQGLGFYLGLSCFKLAVILEGIHYRHSQGQTLGGGFDGIGTLVEPLIRTGIAALDEEH